MSLTLCTIALWTQWHNLNMQWSDVWILPRTAIHTLNLSWNIEIPCTRVNKRIRWFSKLQGNMCLIAKRKIDQNRDALVGSTCTHHFTKMFHVFAAPLILHDLVLVSWSSQNGLCVETKVFGGSVQGVVTIVCHYTEFKLSGIASLCWLGVLHGIPKGCELWCHDKPRFLSWWELM